MGAMRVLYRGSLRCPRKLILHRHLMVLVRSCILRLVPMLCKMHMLIRWLHIAR